LKELAVRKRMIRVVSKPVYLRINSTQSDTGTICKSVTDAVDEQLTALQGIKDRVTKILEDSQRTTESEWKAGKLGIVPGHELLVEVCRKFGANYNKDRDCQRLASLFKENEIPSEIRQIISSVAR
jgi:hypothetical protein